MATVTSNNNDYEVQAEAMQQLVTMGYFDSVEYDSENDAVVCKDADEHAVLTLSAYSSGSSSNRSYTTVSFRLDDGTVKTWNVNHSATSGATNGYIGYCLTQYGDCVCILDCNNPQKATMFYDACFVCVPCVADKLIIYRLGNDNRLKHGFEQFQTVHFYQRNDWCSVRNNQHLLFPRTAFNVFKSSSISSSDCVRYGNPKPPYSSIKSILCIPNISAA